MRDDGEGRLATTMVRHATCPRFTLPPPSSLLPPPSSLIRLGTNAHPSRLGVGFIGSGFNTRFHIQAWQGVRDADVRGVWSPNQKNAASAAQLANDLQVGPAKAYRSITEMVADPEIHALWLCGPNQARVENVEEICDAIANRKGELVGIACEKPLARGVAEAKHVLKLIRKTGIMHGYLENSSSHRYRARSRVIWPGGPRPLAAPTSPAPPRSIPDRTTRGSGRATSRVAACSMT